MLQPCCQFSLQLGKHHRFPIAHSLPRTFFNLLFSLKVRSHLSSLTWAARCQLSLDGPWEVSSQQGTWSAGLHGAPTSATLLPVSMLQWRNAVYCWTVWCSKCQACTVLIKHIDKKFFNTSVYSGISSL